MRLTPIEIRHHRFGTRMRGLDRQEVRTFLEMIVADFEEIVRENAQLRRESERLAREVDAYRSKEQTIHETMTVAQAVVEDLKQTALKESELVVATAEVQAAKILEEAQTRRADLGARIHEMQHVRRQVEIDLRRTLQGYIELIDAFRAAEEPGERPLPPGGEGDRDGNGIPAEVESNGPSSR